MSAVQQIDSFAFGTGIMFSVPAGGTQPLPLTGLNDVSVAIKSELKEIYGEGKFPLSVADAHSTIDITAKTYSLNLADIANDFNASAPASSLSTVMFQEQQTIPTTPFKVTLANGSTLVAGTVLLYVFQVINGRQYPVRYTFVTAGSEVAGVSASITGVGVITFAAGDTGLVVQATYQYTSTAGQMILLTNQPQNSAASYSTKFWKRDKSPIDGTTRCLQYEFFAVRPGGFTAPYSEGSWTNYEKTYKAYADPTGNVCRLTTVNT